MSRHIHAEERPCAAAGPHVSTARFCAVLVAFLALSWCVDHLFLALVGQLRLDDSTRHLFAHYVAGNRAPIIGDVFVHHIPKALVSAWMAWSAPRLVNMDPRAALLGSASGRRAALLAGALLALAAVQLVSWIARGAPSPSAFSGRPLLFLGVYAARFAPSAATEEIVFRGVVFQSLRARVRLPAAALISLALFGIGHLYGGVGLAAQSLVIGAILITVYARTGSIMATTLLHAASNVIHAVLFYGGGL